MQRQAVKSSNISSVGYNPEKKELEIEFRSGRTYLYSEVALETYENLISASSVGSTFHQTVKGKYSYKRLG